MTTFELKKEVLKELKAAGYDKEFRTDFYTQTDNDPIHGIDVEVENYRIISDTIIDEIMKDELSGDLFALGCFTSWFLADVLGIDQEVIEAMQEAEAFEAVGLLVVSMNKLDDLQYDYVAQDGYGHHFGYYDGSGDELYIGDCGGVETLHVFRIS